MSEETTQEIVEKNQIPNFFPTFKVKRNLYPVPIIISVVCSGILAYLTYVEAGIQIDGGYISETEFGAIAGLINGIIFTVVAAISSFIIIFEFIIPLSKFFILTHSFEGSESLIFKEKTERLTETYSKISFSVTSKLLLCENILKGLNTINMKIIKNISKVDAKVFQ